MGDLVVMYWRDIPAQVNARAGRQVTRVPLAARFGEAIDRAAMRAGLFGSDAYLEQWRRGDPVPFEGEPEAAAAAAVRDIEAAFDETRLERLVRAGGQEPADASTPTPGE